MKVKIIEEMSPYDLEKAVNRFIENRTDIIDIKYSGCGSCSCLDSTCYSALIIIGDL